MFVCNRADLFALFAPTPAVWLRHASDAIYLLQGLILAVGTDNPIVRPLIVAKQTVVFRLLTMLRVLLLFAVPAVIFTTIERPAIDYGKRAPANKPVEGPRPA